MVGTSATAVTIDDNALGALIADGSAVGELTHGTESISLGTPSGAEESIIISRLFTNDSGSGITVREVGLHCQAGQPNKSRRAGTSGQAPPSNG